MKIIQSTRFDVEELAVLRRVWNLLEVGPYLLADPEALARHHALSRVRQAIITARLDALTASHKEFWDEALKCVPLPAHDIESLAGHMAACKQGDVRDLDAAFRVIDKALAHTTEQ